MTSRQADLFKKMYIPGPNPKMIEEVFTSYHLSLQGAMLKRIFQKGGLHLLANIRPNILHILGISLLPLFYPYGRYLALLYIYRLDPTFPRFLPATHPYLLPGEIWLVTDSHTGRAKTMTYTLVFPSVTSASAHSLRANPRYLGKSSRPCEDPIFVPNTAGKCKLALPGFTLDIILDLDLPLRNSDS